MAIEPFVPGAMVLEERHELFVGEFCGGAGPGEDVAGGGVVVPLALVLRNTALKRSRHCSLWLVAIRLGCVVVLDSFAEALSGSKIVLNGVEAHRSSAMNSCLDMEVLGPSPNLKLPRRKGELRGRRPREVEDAVDFFDAARVIPIDGQEPVSPCGVRVPRHLRERLVSVREGGGALK